MTEPKRERAAVTAALERRLLVAIAHKLPPAITSDHLTILGVLGALGVGTGYALSSQSPHWLWLASAALVLNWFGDSLDGTVARVRRTERPRYGYYLDHAVDAFTTAVIGIGIGLSPYLPLTAGILLVVLYLMMSVNVYLESVTFGVFRMDYGWVGPTEVRILLIMGNILLVGFDVLTGLGPESILPAATLGAAVVLLGMGVLLLVRFVRNLRVLARLEPSPSSRTRAEVESGVENPASDKTETSGALWP